MMNGSSKGKNKERPRSNRECFQESVRNLTYNKKYKSFNITQKKEINIKVNI